jgi:hypothetical protein
MMSGRSGNGTSTTADNINLTSPLDSCRTTKFSQHADGCFDSLFAAFSGETSRNLRRNFAPHLAQCLPQTRRFEPLRNSTQYQIEQWPIRLWENLFDRGGESINDMRFS